MSQGQSSPIYEDEFDCHSCVTKFWRIVIIGAICGPPNCRMLCEEIQVVVRMRQFGCNRWSAIGLTAGWQLPLARTPALLRFGPL
jgi:hypothetical protein